MRITLKQLMIFQAVAQTGQVAKAAKVVNLSAPATSMALAELEKNLNTQLFERSGNRLQLNSQGRVLQPLAAEVLTKAVEIEHNFSGEIVELTGVLTVCASSTIGNYLLAKAVVAFTQQHPQAHVELTIDNTQQVIKSVARLNAEIGFIEGDCLNSKLEKTPWHQDHLTIFCHPTHPFANKTISIEQLKNMPWVLREAGSGTREYFLEAAKNLNLQPQITHSFSTPEAIQQAVNQGAGFGILSELVLVSAFERQILAPIHISDLTLARPFYLIRHQNHSNTPLAEAFIRFCDDFLN